MMTNVQQNSFISKAYKLLNNLGQMYDCGLTDSVLDYVRSVIVRIISIYM